MLTSPEMSDVAREPSEDVITTVFFTPVENVVEVKVIFNYDVQPDQTPTAQIELMGCYQSNGFFVFFSMIILEKIILLFLLF